MGETDTFEHIRKIQGLLPEMKAYNDRLMEYFEEFLNCQTMENIMRVCEYKQGPVSRSSYNTYKHIRMLHQITDIAVREISVGYSPITKGVCSYREAIDRYRRIIFMLRRHELMDDDIDNAYIDEATAFILTEDVSAVAIHDIIVSDICFFNSAEAISHWKEILLIIGRDKDAMLLGRL